MAKYVRVWELPVPSCAWALALALEASAPTQDASAMVAAMRMCDAISAGVGDVGVGVGDV